MMPAACLVTAPGVSWCQDTAQVLIVLAPTGQAFQLTGLDAAVWGWFSLCYSYADVLEFARAFLNLPVDQAAQRLEVILARWLDLGLLVAEGTATEQAWGEIHAPALQEAVPQEDVGR